jgi:hypothetical protein
LEDVRERGLLLLGLVVACPKLPQLGAELLDRRRVVGQHAP